jgi:DNA-directed RNA polymerase beta' subunit
MAFKKENRPKATFSQITIGLASPDSILEKSYGEVLKPETITIVLTNLKEMVCFAKGSLAR